MIRSVSKQQSVPSVKDALDGRRAHTFELGTGGSAIHTTGRPSNHELPRQFDNGFRVQAGNPLLVRSWSAFGQPDFHLITTSAGVLWPVPSVTSTETGTKKHSHATGRPVHHGPTLFPAACWMVYDGSLRLGPQATVSEPLARWIHSQSGDQGVRRV
ncbi:hypothetical protein PCANC_23465 [Puccinia coronata f. sp. avenae]|uniref:Uncharacterized protein n=1 Tax=Puccinia coronata f. sp. avenae TaxID=200324 RepID=A0A2N5TUD0_9BASI|nr:hypothetical protein PCANC_23465 [Puccinia coronata f. sp. avenae]